jgi:hypothetical protein
VLNESECVVVDGYASPGIDRQAGHPHDIDPRFARQAGATLKPFDDAVCAGIVSSGDKTQIAELQPQPLQEPRRGGDCLHGIERVCESRFRRHFRHQLRDALRTLFTDIVGAQSALLPKQIGEERHRQIIVPRRSEERVA